MDTSSIFDSEAEPSFKYSFSGREIVPAYRPRDSVLESGHDVLPPAVQRWLETSCRHPWRFCKWTCEFLFADKLDAAMFKVTWL